MKTIFTLLLVSLAGAASAQLPNPGFENWTSGNPDLWMTNNVVGFATPITQATPSHSGNFALRGEVVNPVSGPLEPLLSNLDATSHGSPVSQSYTLFSFYYKCSITGTAGLNAVVYLTDAGGAPVAAGGQIINGTASSFTQANIPIFYSGSNPTEVIVILTLTDTAGGTANVGDYFIIDDLSLGFGSATVQAPGLKASINGIWPNPASVTAQINYSIPVNADVLFSLYSLDGKLEKEISQKSTAAGVHTVTLDVADLPAGVYTLNMTSPGMLPREQKIILAK